MIEDKHRDAAPTTGQPPGIRLTGSVHYGHHCLFRDVSLELPSGQWTCLLGPSGIGKSTLLKLLAGLPTGGQFDGEITASDGGATAGRAAYMAQTDLLFPWLDVKQNIMLGQRLRGGRPDTQRADTLLHKVGLAQHADKRPHQLSGGMRQRTALARTLMEDTPIVLLDEPFSALDARTRADMQEMAFTALNGKTLLLVTHDPAEAVRLSHQLYLMSTRGIALHTLQGAEPIRAIDDASTLAAQAALLLALKQKDPP